MTTALEQNKACCFLKGTQIHSCLLVGWGYKTVNGFLACRRFMCIPKVGFGIPQKVPPLTVNALCLLDQKRPALKKMLKKTYTYFSFTNAIKVACISVNNAWRHCSCTKREKIFIRQGRNWETGGNKLLFHIAQSWHASINLSCTIYSSFVQTKCTTRSVYIYNSHLIKC